MSRDHIKEHWESSGHKHVESHWASWGDNWMIDLEIDTIGKHIKDCDRVLDVGYANGYSTFRHAASHELASITGVDFAVRMVTAAQITKHQKGFGDNINFTESDVRSLQFSNNKFDLVYTTRTLINLPTWPQQMQGIAEYVRVVKPNGSVVLSEGFWEP
jgi:ubiquinone/menaquinone biosynthesis C-methylase UbiE